MISPELVEIFPGNINEFGDGITIFFGEEWTCESFKWSSGGNVHEGNGILKTSFVPVSDVPTEIVSKDAFVIGIFKKNDERIQIATTHLESGDTTTKGNKDLIRTETIKQIIGLTIDTIPTVFGFDGNSSAYDEHTNVVGELKKTGFKSAIKGHTIQDDLTYDENTHLISSLKQRGWITNQPWKPDKISHLIDYLAYKGLEVIHHAQVPTGNNSLMGKYALPSDWSKFKLPSPEDRADIQNWNHWASDHIAVGATFKIGKITFRITTLNALAIPLTFDGFSKGSKWKENATPFGSRNAIFYRGGGKRTRRRRNRKTRRRRGLSRHPTAHNPVMTKRRTQMPKRM